MIKTYLYAAIFCGLIFSHIWAYQHGKDIVQARADKAALKYIDKENKGLIKAEDTNQKLKIITHERIVYVDKIIDQCLDRDLPDDIKRLRDNAVSRRP